MSLRQSHEALAVSHPVNGLASLHCVIWFKLSASPRSQSTGRLLQQACELLLEMSDRDERKNIEQIFRRYQTVADEVYAPYWDYEITPKEREWLKNCWKVLSQTGTRAKNEITALIAGEENQQILEKMRELGLILKRPGDSEQAEQSNTPEQHLEDTDAIAFSEGFATFLIRQF
jgi:hypothetical protein